MIRKFEPSDMERVLSIWLEASVRAHDFVAADFWESQVDNMRNIYLPGSETFVFESASGLLGFYSLVGDILAAIFVQPSHQGRGIGKTLLSHARSKRGQLTLTVYRKNEKSCRFYLSQGFEVTGEQVEEHSGCVELVMATQPDRPQ